MEIKIAGLHQQFLDSISQALTEMKARGFSVGIHSGLRTIEEQNRLYELGRSVKNPDGATDANPRGNVITKTIGGFSWHNYGVSADIVFKDLKGNWTWDVTNSQWDDIGKVGEMFGLEWGGRWNRFPDFPHFQRIGRLKNYSLTSLKTIALEKGIDAVWALI